MVDKELQLKNKTEQHCLDCEKVFESPVIRLLGVERVLSTSCPDCRAKRRAEAEKQEREAINREYELQKIQWLNEANIPRRFYGESFDTFQIFKTNKNIYNVCKEYAVQFPLVDYHGYKSLGIFSSGVWGVGKSHLVCSIAKYIVNRWIKRGGHSPVYYVTEPQMFNRIRASFNRSNGNTETEQDVYRQLINVPLLIVDDMGKEDVSDPRFVQRVWFSVINGRYDNMLPMVITANLNPDEISHHLGGNRNNEASFDRLIEMTHSTFWEVKGESYRQKLSG